MPTAGRKESSANAQWNSPSCANRKPTEFSMMPKSEWQTPECVLPNHPTISAGHTTGTTSRSAKEPYVQMDQHLAWARLGHVQRLDLRADLARRIIDAGFVLLRQLDFGGTHCWSSLEKCGDVIIDRDTCELDNNWTMRMEDELNRMDRGYVKKVTG